MATKQWVLIDATGAVCENTLCISGSDVGGAADCRAELRTLSGGLCDGLRVLELANGPLRVALLPERGMGIWKIWYGDEEIGWQSPILGPVHPKFVPIAEPSGLGWLDGFDELLVRCGLTSNGAPEFDDHGNLLYPLHGRIANLPAHQLGVSIDETSGEITATGVVDETRFLFNSLRLTSTVRLTPDSSRVQIIDQVENRAGVPAEMQLLYHINVGAPFHAPGAELVLPARTIAPRDDHAATDVSQWSSYGQPEAGLGERVFFFDLNADQDDMTCALLKASDGKRGVSVRFNREQLPCFTQWKNTPAPEDGYVTGLEPATNFPNVRSFEAEHDRVVKLAAGQAAQFDLSLEFHPDMASVQAVEAEIDRLRAGTEPTVHETPRSDWSAGA